MNINAKKINTEYHLDHNKP